LPQCQIVAVPLDCPQPVAELEFVLVLLSRSRNVFPPQIAHGIGAARAQRDEVVADEAGAATVGLARGGAGHDQRE
jgi:hypothetical protein